MSKKITQKEYENRIYNLYGDEYSVIGTYIRALDKIKIKHNICDTEFDVIAVNFSNGKSKCPLCTKCSNNITDEIFKKKISITTNGEYIPLTQYKGANIKVTMRHNNCSCEKGYYDWDITPHNFLDQGNRCPFESHQVQYTIDIFKERLYKHHPQYKCIGTEYINSGLPIDVMCENNHIFGLSLDNIQKGCPYCASVKTLKGYNDIATTHPNIFNVLINKEDGYKYSISTHKKLTIKCPYCGNIMNKIPSIVYNENGQFVCNSCGDGFSYPEKFFSNLLNQLDIDYVFQLTSSDYLWCGKYRYDFYIPTFNLIIEIHGRQHYIDTTWSSLKEISENDFNKKELAIKNGYDYIVIDARYSKKDYIKNSILNSKLSSLIDLSIIDWEKCNDDSIKSIKNRVIECHQNEMSNKDIAKVLHISEDTVYRYINNTSIKKIS